MNEREAQYSQPKLELYGLYHMLCHFRLYIIGVKNLIVEVDAKYIKEMLNCPDLQPNAVINQWIGGILTFSFKLVHIPAKNFKGTDGLSWRRRADDDTDPEVVLPQLQAGSFFKLIISGSIKMLKMCKYS